MMASFMGLPLEMQRQCFQYLDGPSVRSVRLVSRATAVAASEYIVQLISVFPNTSSIASYLKSLDGFGKDSFYSILKKVILNTENNDDIRRKHLKNEEYLQKPPTITETEFESLRWLAIEKLQHMRNLSKIVV